LRRHPQTVERFHDRFGQFAGTAAVQGCAGTDADDCFVSSFSHAAAALLKPDMSDARNRLIEARELFRVGRCRRRQSIRARS
jgi:hypothetical protein